MYKGESYTITLDFETPYDIDQIQDLQLSIGGTVVGILKEGTLYREGTTFRCEIEGLQSKKLHIGNQIISLYVDDTVRGIIKKKIGFLYIEEALNTFTDSSINMDSNMLIQVSMVETTNTINITL